MSFYTSLSGLQAAQTDLSTISHNIANVATNGFKKSRSQFADVIATSVQLAPTQMVGSGTVLKGNVQQFGQGNLIQSANGLDLAISGDGFFAVKSAGTGALNYTRNGGFSVDSQRFIVDGNGNQVQAYPVDGSGGVVASGLNNTVSLQLPETSGVASPTSLVNYTTNLSATAPVIAADNAFDRFDPSSYNNSTTTTIYDADGQAMTLTSYFRKESAQTAAGGTDSWSVYSFVGDHKLAAGGSDHQTFNFDASGNHPGNVTFAFDAFTPAGSTKEQQLRINFAKTTQVAAPFKINANQVDGTAVGQLQGVTVDSAGIVKASFSNGDVKSLGKVALVNFTNPAGLRQTGDSYWNATGLSGEPITGSAGEGGLGKLMTSTIERSNVDITEELVGLIAAQRNFQANAKALDTASQISQTIFNIRS